MDLAAGRRAAGWAKATKHVNCTPGAQAGPRATLANTPKKIIFGLVQVKNEHARRPRAAHGTTQQKYLVPVAQLIPQITAATWAKIYLTCESFQLLDTFSQKNKK